MEWKIEAVGTENGKAVIWVRAVTGLSMVIPTSVLAMSKLAGHGVPVRNIMENGQAKGQA